MEPSTVPLRRQRCANKELNETIIPPTATWTNRVYALRRKIRKKRLQLMIGSSSSDEGVSTPLSTLKALLAMKTLAMKTYNQESSCCYQSLVIHSAWVGSCSKSYLVILYSPNEQKMRQNYPLKKRATEGVNGCSLHTAKIHVYH
jgi:hypothetical protein